MRGLFRNKGEQIFFPAVGTAQFECKDQALSKRIGPGTQQGVEGERQGEASRAALQGEPMSGAIKGRAHGEAAPQAPPSAAFGVSWADVTGQWEGLITSVGSSVGGLLPVVEPGSLVAGTATSLTKRPQARIASAPHADGRKPGDQRNAKKRSEHKAALSADPLPVGLAVGGKIAVHTSSIAAAGKGDQATVSNDTEQALADELPASGKAPSQSKAQVRAVDQPLQAAFLELLV